MGVVIREVADCEMTISAEEHAANRAILRRWYIDYHRRCGHEVEHFLEGELWGSENER